MASWSLVRCWFGYVSSPPIRAPSKPAPDGERRLAGGGQEGHRALDRGLAGPASLGRLDQWSQMRRVPGVGAHHAFGVPCLHRDLSRGKRRGAAAQDRGGLRELLQTAEVDRLLDGLSPELDLDRVAAINCALREMDRELVLIDFTAQGPFDQDLAIPIPPVPLLEPVRRLAGLDPASDQARLLATELLRNRNKVTYHLRLAERAGERVAHLLGSP